MQNLKCGVFIRYTMESVLQDMHGKQLMCECLYLYGTMLLLLEHHILVRRLRVVHGHLVELELGVRHESAAAAGNLGAVRRSEHRFR